MRALFVHGMGRSPLSGGPLLRALRANGVQATSFANIAATQRFDAISTRLAARIAALAPADDYVLIGHSLGGVLLRSALAALPPATRPPTRVFLLGSPIRASRLAACLQHNPLYRLLTGDCGQLLASESRMRRIGPCSAPSTAILGNYPVRLTASRFAGEPNDGVVSATETRADWIEEEVTLPVMHSFLPGDRRVVDAVLARVVGCLAAPSDDLANRRPVWEALSELFLDTDVSASRDWRARQLAVSPYTIEQLERILIDEVCPVCQSNLHAVAGVWTGFDAEWLAASILRRRRLRRNALLSHLRKSRLPEEWHITKSMIDALRRA